MSRAIFVRSEKNDMKPSDYEQAVAALCGFEKHPDPAAGAGWYAFHLDTPEGQVRVWRSKHWCRAIIIDDHFRHHSKHNTLVEALKNINGTAYGPDSNPRRYALCCSPPKQENPVSLFSTLFPLRGDFIPAAMSAGLFWREQDAEEWWNKQCRA